MNGAQAAKTAGCVGSLIARHAFALGVTTMTACLVWTMTYVALLLWAIVTDSGVGGPLAYPAGLLFAAVTSILGCLVLLFPSTVLAEWSGRNFRLPVFVQIPVSMGILAILLVIGVAMVAAVESEVSVYEIWVYGGVLFLSMLLPLGLYWWSAQSAPLMISLIRRIWRVYGG